MTERFCGMAGLADLRGELARVSKELRKHGDSERYLKRKRENLECPDRATKYVKRCSVYVYVQSNYSGTLAAEYLAKCNVS